MNQAAPSANPFYASRIKRVATRNAARDRPVYARLPLTAISLAPFRFL